MSRIQYRTAPPMWETVAGWALAIAIGTIIAYLFLIGLSS